MPRQVLDLSGPLAKILELGYYAKESGIPVDPDILIGWTQRTICLLGNANCALSAERRKSILLLIDPRLVVLASTDADPEANGLLFGPPFAKDMRDSVSIYTSINKSQANRKSVV